jgi:hypothetical protein
VIRIDVRPAWENPTNTSCALPTPVHAHPAYASYGQSSYVATFHWLPRSQNKSLQPKEVLTTKDRLAQPSSWVATFLLPCDSPRVGERSFGPMITQLAQLTESISLAYNWCVQYLLTRSTHQSLTDTGGGYNLGGAGLPHIHSPTFPTSCLPFHLLFPSGLQFNQVLTTKSKF